MIPVTRVENYCATGTEAFRGACYGVASGACDICLALGVEKLKDTGYGGLPYPGSGAGSLQWQWFPNLTAPGSFAQLDVLDGFYDIDGKVPCQVDGGLKCFGHPIGASGLRMLYEMYLQLHGRAGERQLDNPRYGLTHNLGGFPFQNICSIAIIGKYK